MKAENNGDHLRALSVVRSVPLLLGSLNMKGSSLISVFAHRLCAFLLSIPSYKASKYDTMN